MTEHVPSPHELHCVVVTPEKALPEETVEFVVLPMYDGELGVLPGRAALIGRLGYGELRIRRNGITRRYFVDGGFAQVRGNVVTVLTPRVLKAEEIKVEAVQQALNQALAEQVKAKPEAQDANLARMERARVQLRIARHREGTGEHGHA